jgi:hypothetical protein
MSTFEAVAATLVVIIPGALYLWGYERMAGSWNQTSPDRIYRFVAGSAVFQLLFAPLSYWLWKNYFHSDRIAQAKPVPLSFWLTLSLYGIIPAAVGLAVGRFVRKKTFLGRAIRSSSAPPRAWDKVFSSQPQGLVRIKLKSGNWIAGVFAETASGDAYASGYPAEQDIWLPETVVVDPTTGEYALDANRLPKFLTTGILVNWSEVEYLTIDPRKEPACLPRELTSQPFTKTANLLSKIAELRSGVTRHRKGALPWLISPICLQGQLQVQPRHLGARNPLSRQHRRRCHPTRWRNNLPLY